ncbi:MFS transporter [Microbacterium sp. cx-55]|uniref:MFS transporter n=1 Tax=unclassified Microbacterium TaxID=2609290 RepID=UPI001CBB4822|nr:MULTISPECIES: MFS transporter [unclassified Microbacterium]MBZ4487699.1 MFS transporter [Microbacterium sp. cx-55]MCC4908150.1 MFS transporter [Microbacterium sp. cx-59]UGB35710.1 MFS transporter [Microbacterium sp. cx-55]
MPGAASSPNTGANPITTDIPLSPATRWRAFWVCVAVAGLTILDLSKVNVALPSIETAFGAGSTELQLIVSGYVLTFGLFLVPMGRIGDQRSRRALFLIGLSVFTLASVACAVAPNTGVLLAARLVQGMAAGTQMPQVLGLIQQLFQGKERGRAFGLFGATIGVATAFGPTLGGLLIAVGGETDGWRLIFWMNLPLGLAAIAAAVWLLPTTRTRSSRPLALDPIGLVLFGLTIVALMAPFLFTTGSPSDDPRRWWLLVAFVLVGAGFIAWERRYAERGKQPLIPLGLFKIASYRNGTILQAAYFTAAPSMFLLTTLYLQSGLHIEPVFAGMVTIGFALASAVSSWVGGNLVGTYGRPVVVWGLALVLVCVAGLVATALYVPDAATPYVMAGVMIIGGIGGGLVISPNQTLTLADIPVRQGGLAGSVGQLGQRIGTAVGTAIALALFYATVYREQDVAVDAVVFHDAYGFGMVSVGIAVAIAFVISVVDLSVRRRSQKLADASS